MSRSVQSDDAASRLRVAAFATLALLTALVMAACGRSEDASAEETSSGVVIGSENIAVVELDTILSGPSISGSLAAEQEATVRAEIAGPVIATYVEAGERVPAGKLLARIDDAALQDAYLSARSGVTAAQSNADVAVREEERAQRLVEAGAIAERAVEQARSARIAAESQLADAKARLSLAQEQIADTRITAPFAGVVSVRHVDAGDVVSPGTELVTIVDPSSMRLEASVPADQLSAVRVGSPVSFTVSGYPGREFTGRITRVNPVADPATRQVRIFASIPNSGRSLVGGLFAEGRVESESRMSPLVPMSALDDRGMEPTVMRIRDGKVEKVTVRVGLTDEATERAEILAGVAAGDTVLLGSARGITPGTAVSVGDPSDSPAPAS